MEGYLDSEKQPKIKSRTITLSNGRFQIYIEDNKLAFHPYTVRALDKASQPVWHPFNFEQNIRLKNYQH